MAGSRRWMRDARVWVGAGGFLAVAVLVVVMVVWWSGSAEEEPRARQYHDVTACLLTDSRGVVGDEAASVWAGMQEASLSTLTKVQFLEVDGPETVENARSYLGSLVLGGCDLVVAVGQAQVGAVSADAAAYPDLRFVVVGGGAAGGNVSRIEGETPETVSAAVAETVSAAVGG